MVVLMTIVNYIMAVIIIIVITTEIITIKRSIPVVVIVSTGFKIGSPSARS